MTTELRASSPTPSATADWWPCARVMVHDARDRFCDVLASVTDPTRRAIGRWSIADTAAHVLTVATLNNTFATGAPVAAEFTAIRDMAAGATLDKVFRLNDLTIETITERDPAVLAARVHDEVEDLLVRGREVDGAAPVTWLGGLRTTPTGVLGHLVSELLVHGHDIATADGRAFDVPDEYARLFFQTFFFETIRNPQLAEFAANQADVGPVTWRLHLRGSAPVWFGYDGDRLTTDDDPRRPADLTVTADPAALLLLSFGRIAPLGPVLRRQIRVHGRRPWRIKRMMRVVRMP